MPSATAAVFLATGAVTAAQFAFPEVFEALRRDPGALASGEWWRALSPLLVQSSGRQPLVTVPAVAALGIPVERIYGAKGMLALYLVPAAVGEGLGYAWQPHGAGNSIAALGLACGLGSWLFLPAQEKGRPRPPLNRVRVRGAAVPAGAVADTAVRDIHGLPTLTGAAMGAGLLLRRRSRRPAHATTTRDGSGGRSRSSTIRLASRPSSELEHRPQAPYATGQVTPAPSGRPGHRTEGLSYDTDKFALLPSRHGSFTALNRSSSAPLRSA
nr:MULTISPECIES: rhomboid family intramembrane serine protease [Streptomyces]